MYVTGGIRWRTVPSLAFLVAMTTEYLAFIFDLSNFSYYLYLIPGLATTLCTIMHTLTLSKHQMRLLKTIIESKGVHFPSTTELNEARKKLRPIISTVLDGKGVGVNYEELVKSTVNAQISVVHKVLDITKYENLKMILKDGCDGAGQQSVWKSKLMNDAVGNMFQYGIVPLQLRSDDTVLWKNPAPNSPNCLRPVYLIREKETDEEIIKYVITTTDIVREKPKQNGIDCDVKGIQKHIIIDIKDTMKDLKL